MPITLPGGATLYKKWRFIPYPENPSLSIFTRSDVTASVLDEYDPLTGLLTVASFFYAIKKQTSFAMKKPYYVLFIDIDDFKSYNKVFGLQKGDDLLRYFASRLQRIAVGKGIISRLHGDNFLMALPIETFRKESFDEFYSEISSFNSNFLFSISIGVSRPCSASTDVRKSYEEAFQANHALKGTRGLAFRFFDSSLKDETIENQTILTSLNSAFKNNEFFIVLRPIVDSREGKVSMAEALVRWKSPTMGIVPPDSFISILEKNGMIVELDKLVRAQVYSYIRKRIDLSLPTFPISVNVSRAELEHPSFVEGLCDELQQAGIPVNLLRLEVTETMLVNQVSYFFKNVFSLKNKGFFIEMDDFGSGYSSLLALREIPFDLIKLL